VNTTPAVILGGMTKLLQPLDISVNRTFKIGMRAKWERRLAKHSVTHDFIIELFIHPFSLTLMMTPRGNFSFGIVFLLNINIGGKCILEAVQASPK
jgi:hypothetical protein